jgi:hypothetical protein
MCLVYFLVYLHITWMQLTNELLSHKAQNPVTASDLHTKAMVISTYIFINIIP